VSILRVARKLKHCWNIDQRGRDLGNRLQKECDSLGSQVEPSHKMPARRDDFQFIEDKLGNKQRAAAIDNGVEQLTSRSSGRD
jgi:hypothetical protein